MRRRDVASQEEIRKAIERAHDGKGRQLAVLLKRASLEDLTKAIDFVSKYGCLYPSGFDALGSVLNVVAGRQSARADTAAWLRDARRARRA